MKEFDPYYYYIDGNMSIASDFCGGIMYLHRKNLNNCFKSFKEAKEERDRIKALFYFEKEQILKNQIENIFSF